MTFKQADGDWSRLGRLTMEMEEGMKLADILDRAYLAPLYPTELLQQQAIDNFREEIYKECVNDRECREK